MSKSEVGKLICTPYRSA